MAPFGQTELAMKLLTAVALKGRLEARLYKESSAIVAASFQLAMIASRVGMSLQAAQLLATTPLLDRFPLVLPRSGIISSN